MSDEPLLPHRMTLLGKAMHPIWFELKVQIELPVSRTSTVSDIAGFVSDHLNGLQEAVGRLEDRINGLMSDVVSNETACDAEVHRAVGRIESPVDDLLASYHAIRAVRGGKDAEARELLADAYRHALGEIRGWRPSAFHRAPEELRERKSGRRNLRGAAVRHGRLPVHVLDDDPPANQPAQHGNAENRQDQGRVRGFPEIVPPSIPSGEYAKEQGKDE